MWEWKWGSVNDVKNETTNSCYVVCQGYVGINVGLRLSVSGLSVLGLSGSIGFVSVRFVSDDRFDLIRTKGLVHYLLCGREDGGSDERNKRNSGCASIVSSISTSFGSQSGIR